MKLFLLIVFYSVSAVATIPSKWVTLWLIVPIIFTEIIEFTDSIDVIANSSVQYSCTGVGDDILYLINDTQASDYLCKGFITGIHQDTLNNGVIRRNLTLSSATIDLNNTNVMCRIISIHVLPFNVAYSNVSTLKIQGI